MEINLKGIGYKNYLYENDKYIVSEKIKKLLESFELDNLDNLDFFYKQDLNNILGLIINELKNSNKESFLYKGCEAYLNNDNYNIIEEYFLLSFFEDDEPYGKVGLGILYLREDQKRFREIYNEMFIVDYLDKNVIIIIYFIILFFKYNLYDLVIDITNKYCEYISKCKTIVLYAHNIRDLAIYLIRNYENVKLSQYITNMEDKRVICLNEMSYAHINSKFVEYRQNVVVKYVPRKSNLLLRLQMKYIKLLLNEELYKPDNIGYLKVKEHFENLQS